MAFKEYYDDGIEIIYVDGFKHHCYLIFAVVIIDYKKPVFMTGIKPNI